MKLLLDTHVWLWMQAAPSIKYALGRLPLPVLPADYVSSRMIRSGTSGLSIDHRHALAVASLPPHHRDPFDRLLIAQAQLDDLTLVTADAQLDPYDVAILPA